MGHESFPRLAECSVEAHGEAECAPQVWFVHVAQLGQVRVRDLTVDGDFAGDVEPVDCL